MTLLAILLSVADSTVTIIDSNFMKCVVVLIVILILFLDILYHKLISIMNKDIGQLINDSFERMEGSPVIHNYKLGTLLSR